MQLDDKLVQELQGNEHIMQIVALEELENEYLHKKGIAKTASGFVSPIKDSFAAKNIIKELGINSDKVLIKKYGQKSYVIFKGYAGKRDVLRGTKYLVSNPKVVRMAIGPKGIVKSVKGGFVLTVVLSVGIEVFDYFIRDTASLSNLLGTISGDLIKIGLSSLAAAVAGLAVGSTMVVGSIAAAPLIVTIAVGVLAGYTIDKIDKKYGATNALIKAYEMIGLDLSNMMWEYHHAVREMEKHPELIECIFGPCGFRY